MIGRFLFRIFGGSVAHKDQQRAGRTDLPNVLEEIRARRLQWLGHVAGMPSTRAAARAWSTAKSTPRKTKP